MLGLQVLEKAALVYVFSILSFLSYETNYLQSSEGEVKIACKKKFYVRESKEVHLKALQVKLRRYKVSERTSLRTVELWRSRPCCQKTASHVVRSS